MLLLVMKVGVLFMMMMGRGMSYHRRVRCSVAMGRDDDGRWSEDDGGW